MLVKRVAFFKGSEFVIYNWDKDRIEGGVQSIAAALGGMPPSFASSIDASVNWGNGKWYFFKGLNYVSFDMLDNTVDSLELPISDWAGFTDVGFDTGIDAAFNAGNGKAYFFRGNRYLRYTIGQGVDPTYPKPIAGNWQQMPASFASGLDAVVNAGNGKIYFFKGERYVRLTFATRTVDPAYLPNGLLIADQWSQIFPHDIDSALELSHADGGGALRAPAWRSGCQSVSFPVPMIFEDFTMEVDFVAPSYPVLCQCGEYRQYVRGSHEVNGVRVDHRLPNPTGGPPIPMLPRPGPGDPGDNFLEDGLINPPPGANVHYGHRHEGVADLGDRYLPDRKSGCAYRGTDRPHVRGPSGQPAILDLDFRATVIDTSAEDEVLLTSVWTVHCAGVL
jgi:hypothetical protein